MPRNRQSPSGRRIQSGATFFQTAGVSVPSDAALTTALPFQIVWGDLELLDGGLVLPPRGTFLLQARARFPSNATGWRALRVLWNFVDDAQVFDDLVDTRPAVNGTVTTSTGAIPWRTVDRAMRVRLGVRHTAGAPLSVSVGSISVIVL